MLNINYAGQGELSDARITCLLQNTPILEVLQLIAHQANLTLGVTENGIYLYPPGELPRETKGLREIGWSTQDMKALGTIIYSTGRKDAFSEAQKLIEEVFGDRFKAPKEVRDLLDTIKKRAEEAELRIAESVKQQRSEEPRPSNDSK